MGANTAVAQGPSDEETWSQVHRRQRTRTDILVQRKDSEKASPFSERGTKKTTLGRQRSLVICLLYRNTVCTKKLKPQACARQSCGVLNLNLTSCVESQNKKSTMRTSPRPWKPLSFFSRSKRKASSSTIIPNKDDLAI